MRAVMRATTATREPPHSPTARDCPNYDCFALLRLSRGSCSSYWARMWPECRRDGNVDLRQPAGHTFCINKANAKTLLVYSIPCSIFNLP